MIFLSSFQRERETSSTRKRLEENHLHGFLALPNRSLLTRPSTTRYSKQDSPRVPGTARVVN